jgi:hypothetical protein
VRLALVQCVTESKSGPIGHYRNKGRISAISHQAKSGSKGPSVRAQRDGHERQHPGTKALSGGYIDLCASSSWWITSWSKHGTCCNASSGAQGKNSTTGH